MRLRAIADFGFGVQGMAVLEDRRLQIPELRFSVFQPNPQTTTRRHARVGIFFAKRTEDVAENKESGCDSVGNEPEARTP
jgi:hypothetical protein